MNNEILRVVNATKRYGGLVANSDISFDVQEGEIVGIIGPNGAGKTTLFNLISGAQTPTSGSIYYDQQDITKLKASVVNRLGIGRTFQIPQTLIELTVGENILVGALCREPEMDAAWVITEEVGQFCGLGHLMDVISSSLNVAQKKRLEIARALATRPKLLLLDETMAGLTITERKESLDLIRNINKTGITILTIEHNMDVVMNVSDRVVVLDAGRVLKIGTPQEVTSDESVISAYLGSKSDASSK